MLDPKIIHEFEQAIAGLKESTPIMYSFYKDCIKQGFTQAQSFEMMRDIFTRKASIIQTSGNTND